tara:strand:+ start:115 stop:582 length:468 start_codon:yes stop_codon:yes gene_type:complete
MESINNLDKILDQLVEFSGKLYEVKIDNKIQMPAFSLLEPDFRGNLRNKILVNDKLIPMSNMSILAHILAHEYGHHIYEHVKIYPGDLTSEQLAHIENEADFYALTFIEKYNYDKDEIIRFISDTTLNREYSRTRIDILCGNVSIVEENIDLIRF